VFVWFAVKLFDTPGSHIYFSTMKVLLTPHQEKFVGQKMKGGGYLSQDEVIREALRVYELVEQEDNDPQLEAALRHSLRSPLRKFKPGHFATIAA
jgi:putative addiction module CopG family antidote